MADVSYPTVRYHPFEDPRMIETSEDLAALGSDWRDTPWTEEEKREYQNQRAQQAQPPPLEDQGGSEGETPTPPRRR